MSGLLRYPRGCWSDPEASRGGRALVESDGIVYVDTPYIVEALVT